ncbi:MAG: TIGR00341 family protein [Campylobacterales bacterium]|nr:TIGR00341 family protein [Campylobacterales bacterium]
MTYKKIYILIGKLEDDPELQFAIEVIRGTYKVEPELIHYKDSINSLEKDHYLTYLSDDELKEVFNTYLNSSISFGILPNHLCPNGMRSYGISKEIPKAIEDGLNTELKTPVDLLFCNGLVVFNKVNVGEMYGFHSTTFLNIPLYEKVKNFFKTLFNINYKSLCLTTGKDHSVQTAAVGVIAVEHTTSISSSSLSDDLNIHDGKLNAFILAPASVLSYFYYLISILFYQKFSLTSLPKSLGFIKTSYLKITSNTPLDFTNDKIPMSGKEILLEIKKDGIKIHLGESGFQSFQKDTPIEEKDTVKVTSLPKGEINSLLLEGNIPFFKKAEEDDFKDLFIGLRNSAQVSTSFLMLMILSTLLSTTGLFQNSAPVIIGAMILAPLMAPMISLSMGVIRSEKSLLENSLKTLFYGIATALLVSSIYTLFVPLESMTSEIRGRVNPNILDLMVAIFSGIAGAYANAKEEIGKSLAGVAIAVALVPPLSVTGIGIGWGDWEVIYGSFLLFITNLVGITLAASVTFIILGYSPVQRAKKGIIYTGLMLFIISIPLYVSFKNILIQNSDLQSLFHMEIKHLDGTMEINPIKITTTSSEETIVEIEVLSTKPLEKDSLDSIKTKIQEKLNKKITLEVVNKLIIK